MIGGMAPHIMLVFYLQTPSIVLPRSITLAAKGGFLQAFGLSLKKSVTYSSSKGAQGSRQTQRVETPSGYNSFIQGTSMLIQNLHYQESEHLELDSLQEAESFKWLLKNGCGKTRLTAGISCRFSGNSEQGDGFL